MALFVRNVGMEVLRFTGWAAIVAFRRLGSDTVLFFLMDLIGMAYK